MQLVYCRRKTRYDRIFYLRLFPFGLGAVQLAVFDSEIMHRVGDVGSIGWSQSHHGFPPIEIQFSSDQFAMRFLPVASCVMLPVTGRVVRC